MATCIPRVDGLSTDPQGRGVTIAKGQERMVCKLQRSIYELKQASRTWNIRFD